MLLFGSASNTYPIGLTIHILIKNLPVCVTELLTLTKFVNGVGVLSVPNLKNGDAVGLGSELASTPIGDPIINCLITPTNAVKLAVDCNVIVPVAFLKAAVSCVAMLDNTGIAVAVLTAVITIVARAVRLIAVFVITAAVADTVTELDKVASAVCILVAVADSVAVDA